MVSNDLENFKIEKIGENRKISLRNWSKFPKVNLIHKSLARSEKSL